MMATLSGVLTVLFLLIVGLQSAAAADLVITGSMHRLHWHTKGHRRIR
jgi:hypothetical protein